MEQFTFDSISGIADIEKVKVDRFLEDCFIYDEVFNHEEEELNFKYNYAVKITDLSQVCGDDCDENEILFDLYLTVHRDSLSEERKKSVLGGDDYEINPYDLILDGTGSILIGSEKYDLKTYEEIEQTAMKILSLVPAFDGMRGFFLDRAWNMIGTTGWNSIEYAIGKRKNLFQFGA